MCVCVCVCVCVRARARVRACVRVCLEHVCKDNDRMKRGRVRGPTNPHLRAETPVLSMRLRLKPVSVVLVAD